MHGGGKLAALSHFFALFFPFATTTEAGKAGLVLNPITFLYVVVLDFFVFRGVKMGGGRALGVRTRDDLAVARPLTRREERVFGKAKLANIQRRAAGGFP